MGRKDEERAYARYMEIVSILRENEDREGLAKIETLTERCVDYFKLILRFEIEAEQEYRLKMRSEHIAFIDSERKINHNKLMDCLKSFNKYINKKYPGKIPDGGICTVCLRDLRRPNSVQGRLAIGLWARNPVEALFREGILNKEKYL